MNHLLNIFEERIATKADMLIHKNVYQFTQLNIAITGLTPIINTAVGPYINPYCSIIDSMAITHPINTGKVHSVTDNVAGIDEFDNTKFW